MVCAGVPATSCTDHHVAEGTWIWRVRPSAGAREGTGRAGSRPLAVLAAKDALRTAGTPPPTATVVEPTTVEPTAVAPSTSEPVKAEHTKVVVDQPFPAASAPALPSAEPDLAVPAAAPEDGNKTDP